MDHRLVQASIDGNVDGKYPLLLPPGNAQRIDLVWTYSSPDRLEEGRNRTWLWLSVALDLDFVSSFSLPAHLC